MSLSPELQHTHPKPLANLAINNIEPFRCVSHRKRKVENDHHCGDAIDNGLDLPKADDVEDLHVAVRCRSPSNPLNSSDNRIHAAMGKGTLLNKDSTGNSEGPERASCPMRSIFWEASTAGNQDALSNAKAGNLLLSRSPVHHLAQLLIKCVREDEKLLFLTRLAFLKALKNVRTLELYFQELGENMP